MSFHHTSGILLLGNGGIQNAEGGKDPASVQAEQKVRFLPRHRFGHQGEEQADTVVAFHHLRADAGGKHMHVQCGACGSA